MERNEVGNKKEKIQQDENIVKEKIITPTIQEVINIIQNNDPAFKLIESINTKYPLIIVEWNEAKKIRNAINTLWKINKILITFWREIYNFQEKKDTILRPLLKAIWINKSSRFIKKMEEINEKLITIEEKINTSISNITNSIEILEENLLNLNKRLEYYNEAIKYLKYNATRLLVDNSKSTFNKDKHPIEEIIIRIELEIENIKKIITESKVLILEWKKISEKSESNYKTLKDTVNSLLPTLSQTLSLSELTSFNELSKANSEELFKTVWKSIKLIKNKSRNSKNSNKKNILEEIS